MVAAQECCPKRVMKMRKWPKTESEDLGFVLKYCLATTYPASNDRCCYAKAKILARSFAVLAGRSGRKEVDGIFLCRYPDEKMPTHAARLTSDLAQCPDPERRKMVDSQYIRKV